MVDVSSTPRPWIDLFALPEKFNMALTESDLDPRSDKCPEFFNDCATSELSMRAWNWNVTDSRKNIFDLVIPRYIQIWQSKEMSHDFVRGQSVAETCFSHLD